MYIGEEKIIDVVPGDICKQVHPHFHVRKLLEDQSAIRLLDLGCGSGNTFESFRKYNNSIDWYGIDIESSPEVDNRTKQIEKISTFDGVNIPFDNNFFDVIYSNQVLEHVLFPFELLKECNRVLKSGGYFTGSVSYMEMFHSYSTYNYTPYGLKMIFENSGIKMRELRPGPDLVIILFQKIFGRIPFLSRIALYQYDHESISNRLITILLKLINKSNVQINLTKLLFSGHIRFLAQKL